MPIPPFVPVHTNADGGASPSTDGLEGPRARVDETALRVMAEQGERHIWYGSPDLVMEVAKRAGCRNGHPLNRSAAVMQAIGRSNLFVCNGFIRHLGQRYNVYTPANSK